MAEDAALRRNKASPSQAGPSPVEVTDQMASPQRPTASPMRPLSPHLEIFYPLFLMMMSIAHRITGAALYVGTLLVVWYLVAAAVGPGAFSYAQGFFGSWFGQLVLFGYTFALFHHMMGGIRHLVWDTGHGYGPRERQLLARGSLAASVTLTVVVWALALFLT